MFTPQFYLSLYNLFFLPSIRLWLGVGHPFWNFIFFHWIGPKNDSIQSKIPNIHSIELRIFNRIIHSKLFWGKLFKILINSSDFHLCRPPLIVVDRDIRRQNNRQTDNSCRKTRVRKVIVLINHRAPKRQSNCKVIVLINHLAPTISAAGWDLARTD